MPHPIFTPTAVAADELDAMTVGREELIGRLVDRLRDVALSDARPHSLVVGPRGSGKTHLLAVTLHRALREPAVREALDVAWIPEDALSIGTYEDLLAELAQALDPGLKEQARSLRRQRDAHGLERLLLDHAADRTLVLVLENLDRIWAAIGTTGQSALRGFVETSASVALLASTPLLFSGVASRDQPWYGSFDVDHLGDLTLGEGTDLIGRVVREAGEAALARYVRTARGQARLHAVQHLAGGSPRLWHILAGCITIDTLDELVPAVEALLDQIAPYYQQRLWELPASEQKIVVELGRQPGACTVTELSDAVGTSNRAASTALGRLELARWVRRAKMPGTDQRTTWYELREPLLRHHLQYRETHGEPLVFVVDVLRSWYADDERRQLLARVRPGSPAERHLARSLVDHPARFDSAWADRDPDRLLSEARLWIYGDSAGTSQLHGSRALAAAIEAIVAAVRQDVEAGAHSPRQVDPPGDPGEFEAAVAQAAHAAMVSGGTEATRVGAGLGALAAIDWPDDDADLLTLVSACWDGQTDPATAQRRLAALLDRQEPDDSPIARATRDEHAYWTGEAGDPATARDLCAALVTDHERVLGPDHPDTLTARHGLARWTGQSGDPATACARFAALVPDCARVLGPDHPDTLTIRGNLAYWTSEAGDPATARDMYAALATDYERVLGPNHPDTLTSRRLWVLSALRLGSNTSEVTPAVGPEVLDEVLGSLIATGGLSVERGLMILDQLESEGRASRILYTAAIGPRPLPRGQRIGLLAEAARRDPSPNVTNVLESLTSAMSGRLDALPRLPPEVRGLVPRLVEIDATLSSPTGDVPSPA